MNLEKIVYEKNYDNLTEEEKEFLLTIAKNCNYDLNCLNYKTGEVVACYNNTNLEEDEIIINSLLEMKDYAIDNIKENLTIKIIKEGTKEAEINNLQGNDYMFHVPELNIRFFGNIIDERYIDLVSPDEFSLGESEDLEDIKECIREYQEIEEYIEDKLNDKIEEYIICDFINKLFNEITAKKDCISERKHLEVR